MFHMLQRTGSGAWAAPPGLQEYTLAGLLLCRQGPCWQWPASALCRVLHIAQRARAAGGRGDSDPRDCLHSVTWHSRKVKATGTMQLKDSNEYNDPDCAKPSSCASALSRTLAQCRRACAWPNSDSKGCTVALRCKWPRRGQADRRRWAASRSQRALERHIRVPLGRCAGPRSSSASRLP
jgi:hypothetical protein